MQFVIRHQGFALAWFPESQEEADAHEALKRCLAAAAEANVFFVLVVVSYGKRGPVATATLCMGTAGEHVQLIRSDYQGGKQGVQPYCAHVRFPNPPRYVAICGPDSMLDAPHLYPDIQAALIRLASAIRTRLADGTPPQ